MVQAVLISQGMNSTDQADLTSMQQGGLVSHHVSNQAGFCASGRLDIISKTAR